MHKIKTIDDLKACPKNPRKISEKAADALAKSLGGFGDLSGIVFNKRTGYLVCGHQRVEQLRKLGAVLVDGDLVVDDKHFPIRVVDWPETKQKAANIVANSQAITGEYTDELGELLSEIKLDLGSDDFDGLLLGELVKDPTKKEVKEWDASALSADALFTFFAPIEMQVKIREAILEKYPGIQLVEDVIYV